MVAIVGVVGSGNLSLLSAIIGEIQSVIGQVTVIGKIAYVSQQAWIKNATLRENILFGSPYIEEKYQNVVRNCELSQDFAMLPDGDQTEIGGV